LGHSLIYLDAFNNIIRRLKKLYGINIRIFSVEYPLAPEHVYPAALNCATAAYWWLSRVLKYENIIIGKRLPVFINKAAIVLEEILS
jgi:acetyl esterase/lipase